MSMICLADDRHSVNADRYVDWNWNRVWPMSHRWTLRWNRAYPAVSPTDLWRDTQCNVERINERRRTEYIDILCNWEHCVHIQNTSEWRRRNLLAKRRFPNGCIGWIQRRCLPWPFLSISDRRCAKKQKQENLYVKKHHPMVNEQVSSISQCSVERWSIVVCAFHFESDQDCAWWSDTEHDEDS